MYRYERLAREKETAKKIDLANQPYILSEYAIAADILMGPFP